MNNWLNKLERKYGRFGIPNLTNILVAGQILVFAIELFIDRTITAWVGLNRFFLLQGQIWRAITFVFIPFSGGSILSVVLGIYFTWFVGTALEKEWGDFRYTLYFLLGMVGTVEGVDPALVRCLLAAGFVPVVAPLANSPEGQALNINADTAAGALAGALKAEYFVLVSDVPGVLDAQGRLIPSLNRQEIAALQREGVISGGMIPKVLACLDALDAGCQRALILDGRAPSSLRRYLLDDAPLGTVVA